jgi:hypothetical protein
MLREGVPVRVAAEDLQGGRLRLRPLSQLVIVVALSGIVLVLDV